MTSPTLIPGAVVKEEENITQDRDTEWTSL